jgi:hypothetical protein
MVWVRGVAAVVVAAGMGWSCAGEAALLRYDYTARFVTSIGPYDSTVLGGSASGSFTIDDAVAGSSGMYANAIPSFTLSTATGISVASSVDLQIIDHAPGAGQDALAGHSNAIAGTVPIAGAGAKSLGFYWADDSGTELSSTSLTALPPLTLAGFTNAGISGDYILFSFTDLLHSGAQGEYSLTSLTQPNTAQLPVPEPASAALLLTGLAALAWTARTKRRQAR